MTSSTLAEPRSSSKADPSHGVTRSTGASTSTSIVRFTPGRIGRRCPVDSHVRLGLGAASGHRPALDAVPALVEERVGRGDSCVRRPIDDAYLVEAVPGRGLSDGAEVEVDADLDDGEQDHDHQRRSDDELDGRRAAVVAPTSRRRRDRRRRAAARDRGAFGSQSELEPADLEIDGRGDRGHRGDGDRRSGGDDDDLLDDLAAIGFVSSTLPRVRGDHVQPGAEAVEVVGMAAPSGWVVDGLLLEEDCEGWETEKTMKPSSSKVAGTPMRSVVVAADRSASEVRRSRMDLAFEVTVSGRPRLGRRRATPRPPVR